MKQDKFSNYGALATQGSASLRRIPKKGKAGLAIAGLAAAGGLGVAGVKALKNRKPKSTKDRIKKAISNKVSPIVNKNPRLKKAAMKLDSMMR